MENKNMTDEERTQAIRKERTKLNGQLRKAKISKHKMKVLESVVDNVALMKVKLDELKEQIETEDALVEYDNGGGQTGVRENPIFKRYESLFKTFMIGMNRILDVIPDEEEAAVQQTMIGFKPETVLESILNKQRHEA